MPEELVTGSVDDRERDNAWRLTSAAGRQLLCRECLNVSRFSQFRVPQVCDPAVERATIALRGQSLNSSEKALERLELFAIPNASVTFPSATQATDALDSWEISLLPLRGSVVDLNRRSAFNHDEARRHLGR